MKKKVLALLTCAILLLSLTACGGGSGNSGGGAGDGGSHNFTYIRSGRPARGISGRYYCSFTDGICDGEIRSFL